MKFNYSTNSNNQLLIKPIGTQEPVLVPGSFGIDKDNRLVYHLKKGCTWRKEYGLNSKIIFKGNWRLNQNYDLELFLDETESQSKADTLTISGKIISTARETLSFEVKTHTEDSETHIQILKLGVSWFTDDTNRLSFVIKKHSPDILTLEGQWEINQNQQVTYKYEKEELKTKRKIFEELTFEGFWQITSANRLTYILKHTTDSRFDFRAQIETPTIYPQEGKIKYRIGCGLREDKSSGRIVYLYGTWKFTRRLGLAFQVDCGNGDICESEFGADFSFDENSQVAFRLKNTSGEPLGVSLIFTHKFLKSLDAQVFLRLKKSWDENRIEAGVSIPF